MYQTMSIQKDEEQTRYLFDVGKLRYQNLEVFKCLADQVGPSNQGNGQCLMVEHHNVLQNSFVRKIARQPKGTWSGWMEQN